MYIFILMMNFQSRLCKRGADMAATSVHKLGGSLTQSSILNVKEGIVNVHRVQSVLSMLTTTSTSYILLASLDVARKRLATIGEELITETIRLANDARARINNIEGLYSPGYELLGNEATYNFDPTKLLISVKKLGITGHDVEVWLRERFNIEVEMSDLYNVLCILTPGDSKEDIEKLIHAFEVLVKEFPIVDQYKAYNVTIPTIPNLAVLPRDAFYAETESVPLEESVGRIIAEFVMVYPPGIPIFLPGEEISLENLIYIKKNIEAGLPVQGPEDDDLYMLKVIK
ncbi:arginine/lysine/ornithine decarboxylase [Bacillus sp. OAE603]